MGANAGADEGHVLRGAIDRVALLRIRDVVTDSEPLASAALDDFLNPTVVTVEFEDGLCAADSARIDAQWTTKMDYKFHYTDPTGVNLRWGKHPHNNDYIAVPGLEHYHPPPDASSNSNEVQDSCIKQSPVKLVTRAVLKLWRAAYETNSLQPLNAAQNPP
jgi:hypothetical protein